MSSLLKPHQDLPSEVHPYPTLKGKKRFEMLQAFNAALALYIVLHQFVVPLAVHLLQTNPQQRTPSISFWYLYHVAIAWMLARRFRTPSNAYGLIYLAWFGLGYLPLSLGATFFDQGIFRVRWRAISGLLCYGSSLLLTLFLLYRMRMPTTAFLFSLEHRIIPKWRYAIPYASLGLLFSVFWLAGPFASQGPLTPENQPMPVTNEIVLKRYQYD